VLKSVRRSLVETGLKMALAPLQIGLSQSMKELLDRRYAKRPSIRLVRRSLMAIYLAQNIAVRFLNRNSGRRD
jgi:hypothetical protein